MLSAELRASLGGSENPNVEIITTKTKTKTKNKNKSKLEQNGDFILARPQRSVPSRKKSQRGAEAVLEARKVTKRKRKRLEKLELEKAKKERRAALFKSISTHMMCQDERRLLERSAKIGTKDSKKDKLRKALLFNRAGIAPPNQQQQQSNLASPSKSTVKKRNAAPSQPSATLFVPRNQEDSSSESSASSEEDEDEDEDEENDAEPTPSQPDPPKSPQLTQSVATKAESPPVKPSPPEEKEKEKDLEGGRKAIVVRVNRRAAVQSRRNALPVTRMEQEVMEMIMSNAVTVLCGETGSGKTTQVPQFLFEAGFGWEDAPEERRGGIAVTQPRRVATIGMAKRVAEELGTKLYDLNSTLTGVDTLAGCIGYQIRYDARTMRRENRLKFMTDGVLLREAREDILLRHYSAIVLDEAHERNLNTDILLGILSRIIPLRRKLYEEKKPGVFPLRLVIMSATLKVDDFVNNATLFPPQRAPPVLNVESRQFPVNIHFSRRTELYDYLQVAFKKTCAIHRRLPPGGILVFLTGQREIEWLCEALSAKFGGSKGGKNVAENDESAVDYSDIDSDQDTEMEDWEGEEMAESLGRASGGISEKKRVEAARKGVDTSAEAGFAAIKVLPLYSRLPTKKQMAVFDEVEEGVRLVVVATNVAETSVTIPGIKYVVDCGREKRKTYNQRTGISTMEVGWISKASAQQRSGRAGRVSEGHCYRLYSSAVFNDGFAKFAQPEIATLPIEDVVLYMKSMHIQRVSTFPFVTPPGRRSLASAVSTLQQLGALRIKLDDPEGEITTLGKRVSKFPLRARLAKMLAVVTYNRESSAEQLSRVISLVACLSLQSPFLHLQALEGNKGQDMDSSSSSSEDDDEEEDVDEEEAKAKAARRAAEGIQSMWAHPTSDFLSLLRAVGAYLHVKTTEGYKAAVSFCKSHMLHHKTMEEICKLRWQLAKLVAQIRSQAELTDISEEEDDLTASSRALAKRISSALSPPGDSDQLALSQVVVAGLLDRVARKMSKEEARAVVTQSGGDSGGRSSLSKGRWPYHVCSSGIDQPVYIHQHSTLYSAKSADLPAYVVYNEIITVERTNNKKISYMRQVQRVEPSWLVDLSKGTDQCKASTILDQPSPRYSFTLDGVEACVHPVYGPRLWKLPAQWLPFPVDEDSLEGILLRGGWFARALLDGSVFLSLKELGDSLAIPPAYATRKPYDPRVHGLVQALSIPVPLHSKASLLSAWRGDASFLKPQVCAWMKKEEKKAFIEAGKWEVMVHSIIRSN